MNPDTSKRIKRVKVSSEKKTKSKTSAQTRGVASAKGKANNDPDRTKKAVVARPVANLKKDSKKTQILELLKRPDGATLAELITASGWQPHSVRGFLSGVVSKQLGLTVQSKKNEAGNRSYAIAS